MTDIVERLEKLLEGTTPGPWETETDLPYARKPRIHGADGELIAECGNAVVEDQDRWEANAHLIAASPTIVAEAAAEIRRLREALCQICDADWRWKGGGSSVRIRGQSGKIAAKVLGLPEYPPLGWPEPNETRASLSPVDSGQKGADHDG